MRKLIQWPNVKAPDTDFPFGRSKDNTGINDGTPQNEFTLGDHQQFFEKMRDYAGVIANGLPDNAYNGWQLFDAFQKAARPYLNYVARLSQTSTSAPTPVIFENELGALTWTRVTTGVYQGTFSVAVPNDALIIVSNALLGTCYVEGIGSGATQFTLQTRNTSGTLADGILVQTTIEIRCYK